MIILDTNILSEPMRHEPSPKVLSWLDDQLASTLFISAMSAAEILAGVATMPRGHKRDTIAGAVAHMLDHEFQGRILAFDDQAAVAYAQVREERSRQGRPIGLADSIIAATARSTGMSVATRNIRDFEGTGVDLINPWEHRSHM